MDNATAEPVLIEPGNGFTTHWHCEPPEWGARFRVPKDGDYWDGPDSAPVRHIYKIELIQDSSE